MKHTLKVTLVLIFLFLISQIIGLAVVQQYIKTEKPLPYGLERPPVVGTSLVVYILVAVLIATVLVLLLIKFKKPSWWRAWFFLAVFFLLTIAFNAFMPVAVAAVLALIIAYLKINKPGLIVQNLSEVFVYSGMAAIFAPAMDLWAAFLLLFLISIYDMIAVWKTKHMVKLAKFQAKSNIFAGLLIPYKMPKTGKGVRIKKVEVKTAILGGGDIGLPLIFAGAVMNSFGFYKALIVSLFATIALLLLFIKAKKGKYYPAMPFISLGCFLGYLVVLIMSRTTSQ